MDFQTGDTAHVTGKNRTGTVLKEYGRRVHLKFPNGEEQTFNRDELQRIDSEEELQKGSCMDANATIDQLGGFSRLQAMINARDFGKGKNFLQFRFSGSRKMNIVKIELTPLDEYELTFYRQSAGRMKEVSKVPAWAGNIKRIFEEETGLYLSL